MQQCDYKLTGVLNGIDMKLYDPSNDERITAKYSIADMSGKAADKAALQRMMGLHEDPNVPVMAIVSRLVSHKGLDLICEVLHDMMELPMQLVILGKGDQKYEEFFSWAAQQYHGRMSVCLDYNEALSMAIYSGADLFLMPSKSEPCGLSQMIAMRYGTVPIVRETGGLRDTPLKSKNITVSGYPDYKAYQYYQYKDSGKLSIDSKYTFSHTCSTRGGESGAPAYDSNNIVWGIHTSGGEKANYGCLITSALFDVIERFE